MDRLAGTGNVGDVQRKRARGSQDPFCELSKLWSVRELAHQRVEVLGVVALLADDGGAMNGGQAIEWIGRSERQIKAEEGVAVARVLALMTWWGRQTVQADRNFHADCAEVTVTSLEPAPQPACHHRQHPVVDGRAASGMCHAAQSIEFGGGKCDSPPGTNVAIEGRSQPGLRRLPRGGAQTLSPMVYDGVGRLPLAGPVGVRATVRLLVP